MRVFVLAFLLAAWVAMAYQPDTSRYPHWTLADRLSDDPTRLVTIERTPTVAFP